MLNSNELQSWGYVKCNSSLVGFFLRFDFTWEETQLENILNCLNKTQVGMDQAS